MLVGRFGDTTGAPYLEGYLYIPRLEIGSNISFLVDTGADATVLMPTDGIRMNLPYERLQDPITTIGLGGRTKLYQEGAIVTFAEPGVALYAYAISLAVVPKDMFKDVGPPPSLLGRDIMRRWRMSAAPLERELTFEVSEADYTKPLAS